ncbi:ubiquitin-conjugating enzyme E2 J2 [Angomonas deanei]|uniref:Ubiquitin-conjugating enzyme, putative n=1 Tax=Angomonas deanei TaxID=59799 RepID=A0A7G2C7A1_9TRYP|nr:ubiquitin-conjugating enzyme E2 J2 [Angomonas deanei]CAD2215700.1 Ubiquitin-conjugating enzyme, putative [Angomonas deanei]|eukprot:EPY22863.1 ubiquitin-conjugating enzyme E2 J2 [Angomonas deanei]
MPPRTSAISSCGTFFFEAPPAEEANPPSTDAPAEEKGFGLFSRKRVRPSSADCYAGGRYMGKLVFPHDYPYKPPKVFMLTPSGRLQVNQEICLSNSSFHPESWSPLWGLDSILIGLISFFFSSESTTGAVVTEESHRRELAAASRRYNCTTLKSLYQKYFQDDYEEDCRLIESVSQLRGGGGEEKAPSCQAVNPPTAAADPIDHPVAPSPKAKKGGDTSVNALLWALLAVVAVLGYSCFLR